MKTAVLLSTLAAATTLCAAVGETRIVAGTGPKIAPGGGLMLFQLEKEGRHTVALYNLVSGKTVWTHPGPGESCHPAWGPHGSILFTYSHETNTSFAARAAGETHGYNIRILDGVRSGGGRPLTTGRHRDYSVSYSPAAKTFYYASNAFPPKNDKGTAMFDRTGLFALKDDPRAVPEALFIPQTYNSGVVSPSVSPDGLRIAWASRPSFWAPWCIAVAPLSDPKAHTAATPDTMAAYSPAWSPDGAKIAFTGFEYGDGGWGVWIMDSSTFERKRVCDGRDPCFSPDGRAIFYDRDGFIWRREVAP